MVLIQLLLPFAFFDGSLQDEYTQFLERFGYVPKGLSAAQMSGSALEDALKEVQRLAGIPQTGQLDNWTKRIMKTRRCGMPDKGSESLRQKRSSPISPWKEKLITFKVNGGTNSKNRKDDIRRAVQQAARQWSELADITIEETNAEKANIRVSADKSLHRTCTFGFQGNVLAHAFMPPHGDLHINDDVQFSTRNFTDVDAPSLYAVVAHEIGHTLGFGHSSQPQSIMYAYDIPRRWSFTDYDKKLMRHFYGTKKTSQAAPTEKVAAVPTGKADEDNRVKEVDTIKPDPCHLKDPVLVVYRNEIFVFKNNYGWRVSIDWRRQITEPRLITEMIRGGPSTIDAAVLVQQQLWLFSADEVYVTDGVRTLYAPMKLSDMNIKQRHVRLAYDWHYFNPPGIYIWGEDQYWRLDEKMSYRKADERYPKKISFNWATVPKGVSSAFTLEKDMHFIKGDQVYRMNHSKPSIETEKGYPKELNSLWGFCTPKSESLVSTGISSSAPTLLIFLTILFFR